MIQYNGNEQYKVMIGDIDGVFSLQDLNDLLDELQNLGYEHPISERICNEGELKKAKDLAFECGVQEGKDEIRKAHNITEYDEMCG